MCSKGHIAAGAICASSAAVIATKSTDNTIIFANALFCALSSLLTSQLADIDTPESRISKAFPIMKIITNKIVLVMEFCAICVLICTLQFAQSHVTVKEYRYLLLFIIIFAVQIWLMKNLQHRGITHTLLFNCLLSGIIVYPITIGSNNNYYFIFALGLIVGLFSHLLFDTITIQGCPLFFPFKKKNVKLLKKFKIRSGQDDVYGVTFSAFILFVAALSKVR